VTDYLERALALADATLGRAYPKPDVGAVVVRDGRVVGEGSTEAAGRHGEIVAIDAAGDGARGATLYVTMEPCAHHGSTPPCVDAIIAAGLAKVVVGSRGSERPVSTSSSSTRSPPVGRRRRGAPGSRRPGRSSRGRSP